PDLTTEQVRDRAGRQRRACDGRGIWAVGDAPADTDRACHCGVVDANNRGWTRRRKFRQWRRKLALDDVDIGKVGVDKAIALSAKARGAIASDANHRPSTREQLRGKRFAEAPGNAGDDRSVHIASDRSKPSASSGKRRDRRTGARRSAPHPNRVAPQREPEKGDAGQT